MVKIATVPVLGSYGNDVMAIQNALAQNGCSPGSIDGIFGHKTKVAIALFQKKHNIESSGKLGPLTLKTLMIEVVASSPVQGAAITKDLQGKKEHRHLHPILRLLMEAKIFPGGKVTDVFLRRDIPGMVLATAHGLADLGIHEEGGANKGEEVGYVQAIIGVYRAGGTGDSWCMSTQECIVAFIEDYLQIESPFPTSELCTSVWSLAQKVPGLTTHKCEVGTVYIGQHGNTSKGHTGTVLADLGGDSMSTFEGNRSDRAFIAPHSKTKAGDLKVLGFVRLYPNNKI